MDLKKRLAKHGVRILLAYLHSVASASEPEFDDILYNHLRDWALRCDLIDEGGYDDPGPILAGGGG